MGWTMRSTRRRSRRTLARIGAALIVAVMLSLASFAGAARFNVAHASATPTIVQSWTEHDFGNGDGGELLFQESFTSLTDVTAGDEVLFLIGWGGGNSYLPSGITNNGTAAYSGSFNEISGTTVTDGLGDGASIWATQVSSSGTVNLTLDYAEQGCPCGSSYILTTATMVEVSGMDLTNLTSGQEHLVQNGGGGTTHTTASGAGLGTGNDDLDLAVYVDGGANTSVSVASGESSLGDNDSPTVNIQFAQGSADAASHFEFDTASSAGYAVVSAVSLASA